MSHRRLGRFALLGLTALGLLLTIGVCTASASKQIVDYFGTDGRSGTRGGEFDHPTGIAVNNSGAGPAEKGEIYVVDGKNNRVQRFRRNDQATPGDSSDDTYEFVSAWGAGVDSAVGGSGYEICTVASQCQAGVSSGGNGALGKDVKPGIETRTATGIAVDQDTGDVYVSDTVNFRINVYAGDGTFLRSFGYDVVASGPGQVSGPNERQRLTVKADGGKFSLSFRGKATGPRGTGAIGELHTTIVSSVVTTEGTFEVGQGISGHAIAPGTTITHVEPGFITLSQPSEDASGNTPIFGDTFPSNASAQELETALNALPSIGGVGGSVTVTGGPGDASGSSPYEIEFGGSLAGQAMPSIVATQGGLTTGSGTASASVSTPVEGGAYEVCDAAAGDTCKAGGDGDGPGQPGETRLISNPDGIAVSPADGNPATGTVFLADTGNHRVNTYHLDGSAPSSFGASTFNTNQYGDNSPRSIAVDSRGIVYASDGGFVIERYDTENANGEGIGFLAPLQSPNSLLAVDPDSDGPGPDTDILYAGEGEVRQFGPVNKPGLASPPTGVDETHGTSPRAVFPQGLAVDESDGRLYLTAEGATFNGSNEEPAEGVYVLADVGPPPTATLDSLSDITSTSVTVHATLDPNGPPALGYRLEYSLDGTNWQSTPKTVVGAQTTPQAISALLEPIAGLEPSTLYHVRLVAERRFLKPITTSELTFTTLSGAPIAETTGTPLRTTDSALLEGRVDPRNTATTYHFEYGSEGPCDANPCTATEAHAAGSGEEVKLVAQHLEGLSPATTYHYRVIADNGNAGSPVAGKDVTVTTRASEAPLSHGRLAGPPGSDRAWEQVSMPDSGGNPVTSTQINFSTDGDRATFALAGGTPTTESGSLYGFFFSERTPSGWQVRTITPPRSELAGGDWHWTGFTPDLSTFASVNSDYTVGEATIWRFGPAAQPAKLFQNGTSARYVSGSAITIAVSADGATAVALLEGNADPNYPQATNSNLYEISAGAPRLVSVLPGGGDCVSGINPESEEFPTPHSDWVSADGSRVFFTCGHSLYMRDIPATETKLLSGPPLSGQNCPATFLRSTADSAFFYTSSRLTSEDTSPPGNVCGLGGDVYRYDLAEGSLDCVTCLSTGAANVKGTRGGGNATLGGIVVSEDGSHVYFTNQTRLLPGAPQEGGTYRLNVADGDLAYVGPGGIQAPATNPDGSVLIFDSKAPALDSLGGQQNGGTLQAYRYDDRDRSLVCLSCPEDDSVPVGGAEVGADHQPEGHSMSDDGETIAFLTPTPLASPDQNTAAAGQTPVVGDDVYEWRDGRLLLVTDGLNSSLPTYPPKAMGVSASGRDVYFLAAAQYTPDALDGYQRLYDARVGGGFEFSSPPQPCPLEVCQGTPKGAPEEQAPGTGNFAAPGHAAKPAAKKKKHGRKGKKRHHKSGARHHRAGHKGRSGR